MSNRKMGIFISLYVIIEPKIAWQFSGKKVIEKRLKGYFLHKFSENIDFRSVSFFSEVQFHNFASKSKQSWSIVFIEHSLFS